MLRWLFYLHCDWCVLDVEILGARGQLTEGGGWCVEVLTYLSWVIIFVTLPFSLCVCLKVIMTPFHVTNSVRSVYGEVYNTVKYV